MNPPSPQHASSRSFAALRQPGSRAFLIGGGLAMMADSIEHVISYWVIFQKFHSPTLAGFAVISHWLPYLFFSMYVGALADRFDPRRIIQAGMLLFMAVSACWGVLFLTDSIEMWHAVGLLVLHGFAGVLWIPTSQLLIHDIVGPAQLQSGVRLMATFRTLGMLLGPAIGGAMLLALGPAYGILANVAIYLPLTLWLWKAPYGPRFRAVSQVAAVATRTATDILGTIRRVSGNRAIVSMTLIAGAASLLVGNAHQAQMPEFASDLGYGESGLQYSLLLAANAAGAVIAGLALESRNLFPAHQRTAIMLVILWCGAIGGFAVSTSYAAAAALLFAAGFLELAYNSMAQTLVQLNAPEAMRGRVIGLYTTSSLGLKTFSGVTVGIGGSFIGIHWSLALSAATLLMVAFSLLPYAGRTTAADTTAGE